MEIIPNSEAEETLWDIVVVGTGMGGSSVGHRLSEHGHRVLFLEMGRNDFPGAGAKSFEKETAEERLEAGLWPAQISGNVDGHYSQFFAPIGSGSGGSTLLYAAALERFERCDFESVGDNRHPTGGWPVRYDEFLPYYQQAEALFKVRGEGIEGSENNQHLLSLPRMSECDEHFFSSLQARGYSPRRLHVGMEYKPDCTECLGHICQRQCKSDSRTICLEPALRGGNAALLDQCKVTRLNADSRKVNFVECEREGVALKIRARIVILSAGAYFSPTILLQSNNSAWPDGLANRSGMVGRNLMFHISDFVAIWPNGKYSRSGPKKSMAVRDFYYHGGQRLGMFQSTGLGADYGNIVYVLKNRFDRSRFSWIKPVRPFLRVPAYIASKLYGKASIFATVMEDYPYQENRIIADEKEPSGFRFEYTIHDELQQRTEHFRTLLREAFSTHKVMFMGEDVSLNFGHPCGTCRFGERAEDSVLNKDNRAHDVENLYVVDSSFMPTSAGVNPSLTIAANALRVADKIHQRLA